MPRYFWHLQGLPFLQFGVKSGPQFLGPSSKNAEVPKLQMLKYVLLLNFCNLSRVLDGGLPHWLCTVCGCWGCDETVCSLGAGFRGMQDRQLWRCGVWLRQRSDSLLSYLLYVLTFPVHVDPVMI